MAYNAKNPNGQATMANSEPVVIASDQTVIPVSDNSGSLTVDNAQLSVVGGGAEATALRVTIASDSTGVLSVDDNGGSLTVDGTVTATIAAGAATIAKAEDVASADADVGVPAMAVRKATPANTSGTDGDYEMLQMSAGRLWASTTIDAALPAGTNAIGKLAANTGVTIGAVEIAAAQTLATVTTVGTVSTVTNVVHVDDNSGSLTVDDGAGSITVDAPVGTPAFVRLSDGAAAISTLPVSIATAPVLVAGSAIIGKVGIDQTTPGTTNKVTVGSDVVHTIIDSGSMSNSASTSLQNAVSATGNGSSLSASGMASVIFTITGTFTATVTLEGTQDGTNWSSLTYTKFGSTTVDNAAISTTGSYQASVSGFTNVRARVTWTSGTSVTVTAMAGPASPSEKVVNANLLAGTAAIGKLAANSGVTIGAVEIAAAQTLATVTTVGAVTAITNALPAGTALIGKVGIDQTTPGTTNLVAAGQNGTWTVQPGNTANTTAWKVDGSAVTQPVSGTVTATIAAGASTIAKAEDVASANADTGVPAMAVQKATPANTAGTDGDYEFLQMSAGRLWTSTTVDAALPAGTNAIGKLAANSGVDIGDVDITSVIAGTGATNIGKAEDAAHTTGDTGVMALAVRKATLADLSAGATDGDYEPPQVNRDGALWVVGAAGPTGGWSIATGSIAATKTDIGTANTAGQVGGWYIYNANASVAYVQFFNAQASAVTLGTTAPVYSLGIPASAAANVAPGMVGLAHATAICIAVTTTRAGSTGTGSTVDYNIWYKQ